MSVFSTGGEQEAFAISAPQRAFRFHLQALPSFDSSLPRALRQPPPFAPPRMLIFLYFSDKAGLFFSSVD